MYMFLLFGGGGKTMTYDIGIFYLFIHFYILDVHNY